MSGGRSFSAYEAPVVQKYADNAAQDEGEARWNLEFSRQKLYARGAPQHHSPMRPTSAAQEAYAQPTEPGLQGPQGPQGPKPIAASCVDCQGSMACHASDPQSTFCLACNKAALSPERGIPSLIK